jgi:hypothetical protein
MLMDRLDAMRLFVQVVETGSFSAVAREANIGQPAVSKQIAALEEHLRAQLLHRTSRNLSACPQLGDSGAPESSIHRVSAAMELTDAPLCPA